MKQKKYCILMGSPRKNGNTSALLQPFTQELEEHGMTGRTIWLYEKELAPCVACRRCQTERSSFGCGIKDDMQEIFDVVLACDLLVLATPVYAWYCTPPMKCVLDRLVYGMNKFYGVKKGPSLWAGKLVAAIATCGYPPEKGTDLWEEGLRRYCKHSDLRFFGLYAERHLGYTVPFMEEEKRQNAVRFAVDIVQKLSKKNQP